jgi:hypothetical protein
MLDESLLLGIASISVAVAGFTAATAALTTPRRFLERVPPHSTAGDRLDNADEAITPGHDRWSREDQASEAADVMDRGDRDRVRRIVVPTWIAEAVAGAAWRVGLPR